MKFKIKKARYKICYKKLQILMKKWNQKKNYKK